ncbi:Hypothetical protein, putative [Bodo saltans]|uniref:Uncharacterized protein n=1 Tax=Bodo saltans TaxID=75058 RepID=A0A0S4JLW0_BODSA|nr:Hypothetical protein, putative [Bodo saltans]|eukprot:CUG91108.1 Hypothetical protein, putative [Bodo saltans]
MLLSCYITNFFKEGDADLPKLAKDGGSGGTKQTPFNQASLPINCDLHAIQKEKKK